MEVESNRILHYDTRGINLTLISLIAPSTSASTPRAVRLNGIKTFFPPVIFLRHPYCLTPLGLYW